MSSETPRTDRAECAIPRSTLGDLTMVSVGFARELELDLKAANMNIEKLESLLSVHEAALVNLHDIALDIYFGYHVSEKPDMRPSLIRVWNIGQEIFETIESERREG